MARAAAAGTGGDGALLANDGVFTALLTPVSSLTVSNSSPSPGAGARTRYVVDFNVSASGGMSGSGSQITVTFPAGTGFTGYVSGQVLDVTSGLGGRQLRQPERHHDRVHPVRQLVDRRQRPRARHLQRHHQPVHPRAIHARRLDDRRHNPRHVVGLHRRGRQPAHRAVGGERLAVAGGGRAHALCGRFRRVGDGRLVGRREQQHHRHVPGRHGLHRLRERPGARRDQRPEGRQLRQPAAAPRSCALCSATRRSPPATTCASPSTASPTRPPPRHTRSTSRPPPTSRR